jgi:ribosomal protein S27AE
MSRYIVEDEDGNAVVKQPTCPWCGQLPFLGLDSQAFCGNNACAAITWNPRLTARELIENAHRIEDPFASSPAETPTEDEWWDGIR